MTVASVSSEIFPHHQKHLEASGLKLATCLEAGIYSEGNVDRIRSLIGCSQSVAKKLCAVLVFPFIDIDGRNGYAQVRPDRPRKIGDKTVKYESPKGQPNQLYIPPGVRQLLDSDAELLITEGAKKALKATQDGFATVGLVGVWGWKRKDESALLPTLERIHWTGRRVVVVFDSDITTNEKVLQAEKWLCTHLATRGADVKVLRLPSADDGSKVGLDDYLISHGPAKLRVLLDNPMDPEELDTTIAKQPGCAADPGIEASRMKEAMTVDGFSKLRFWSGSFLWWSQGKYIEVPVSEVRAQIVHHLNNGFSRVGTSEVSNTLEQLKAQTILYARVQPPTWLKPNVARLRKKSLFLLVS